MNASEPNRRSARMIAHAIAKGVGLQMRQVTNDQQILAQRRERAGLGVSS